MNGKIIITDSMFGLDFPKKCQITMNPLPVANGKALLKMLRSKVEITGRCFYKNIFDAAIRSGIHPLDYRADGFPDVKVFYGDLILLLEANEANKLVFRAIYVKQLGLNFAPIRTIEIELKKRRKQAK